MSIAESRWRPGHAPGHYKQFQRDEKDNCLSCRGSGESQSIHRLLGGYSHLPCHYCGGSGEQKDVPEALRGTQ